MKSLQRVIVKQWPLYIFFFRTCEVSVYKSTAYEFDSWLKSTPLHLSIAYEYFTSMNIKTRLFLKSGGILHYMLKIFFLKSNFMRTPHMSVSISNYMFNSGILK